MRNPFRKKPAPERDEKWELKTDGPALEAAVSAYLLIVDEYLSMAESRERAVDIVRAHNRQVAADTLRHFVRNRADIETALKVIEGSKVTSADLFVSHAMKEADRYERGERG